MAPIPQITVGPGTPRLTTTGGSTPTSFTQKRLEVTVKLAAASGVNQPNKFADGSDTITLANRRISARIRNSGTPTGSEGDIQVWGMSLDVMNQLSTLGMVISAIPRNTLSVSAGDDVSGMSLVYSGTILQAYGDFAGSPKVPFHFECQAGKAEDVLPAPASSFPGATDVGTVMAEIAKKMGFGFENSGVNLKIASPYLPGSYGTQWKRLAEAAGIEAALVAGGSLTTQGGLVLAIWPRGEARGLRAPLISPLTGMISYPSYTQQGIIVRTVFNPQIGFGGRVVVQGSLLDKANGTWIVHKLDHELDDMVIEHGKWESSVYGYGSKAPAPILAPR